MVMVSNSMEIWRIDSQISGSSWEADADVSTRVFLVEIIDSVPQQPAVSGREFKNVGEVL